MSFLALAEQSGIEFSAQLLHGGEGLGAGEPLIFEEIDQSETSEGGTADLLTLQHYTFTVERVQQRLDGVNDGTTSNQHVLTIPFWGMTQEVARYATRCRWGGKIWTVQLTSEPEGDELVWKFLLAPVESA